ncbi:MAG: c-type cytochrome [Myxococcaceae bacterium]
MRLQFTLSGLVAAMVLVGCSSQAPDSYTNSSGALALSRDDSLVYAADSDNDALFVVDAKSRQTVAQIKVGHNPEHVIVGADDTIYVSNRGSRSVSVIKKGQWDAPVATVDVGVEPYAMSFTPDGKALLVVNSTMLDSTETGSLMAIDVKALQPLWEVPVGDEPRGVTVVEGNAALVSLSRKGELVRVNLDTHEVNGHVRVNDLANRTPAASANNGFDEPMPMPDSKGGASTFKARSALELASTPDGTRAVSSVTWASDAILDDSATATTTQVDTSSGGAAYGNVGSPCRSGSVATPGTFTVEGKTLNPLVDSLTACSIDNSVDFPPTMLHGRGTTTVQGPTGVVIDPTGQWLFVLDKQSSDVAIMPMTFRVNENDGRTVTQLVPVKPGSVGLAVSRDGKTAWVYSLFNHSLLSITSHNVGSTPVLDASEETVLTGETLSDDAVKGRKLFFSATAAQMSSIGIACGTCHVDGREDGHVWNFTDGPRQTPSLAGRQLGKTAPYHWNGVFPDFNAFVTHTVTRRMGGQGVDMKSEQQLLAFIDSMPTPDNPFKHEKLTDAQLRGAQVFQKAECNTCHAGATLTDNRMVDVGTYVKSGIVVDQFPNGMNTPSLLGVARTAPFLHDGSAATIEERINKNKQSDLHGKTSQLTAQEVSDLAAYVKSL